MTWGDTMTTTRTTDPAAPAAARPDAGRPAPTPDPITSDLLVRQAVGHRAARRLALLDHRLRTATHRSGDGDLGYAEVETVGRDHHALLTQITRETARGATVHRRLPGTVRALPIAVFAIDFLLLRVFTADLLNAGATDLGLDGLAALGLALIGSAVAYAWLTITGLRLRDHRLGSGEIAWGATRSTTWVLLAGTTLTGLALGVLMYERVLLAAVQANDYAGDSPHLLAALFAILNVIANLTVVAVHALDGSALAARARRLGRAVRRAERRAARIARRRYRTIGGLPPAEE